MIEYACKDVVFHFNKKHLEDSSVPMWVLKTHGETFYVNHVECEIGWSTKETPDNSHTKGSIKFKDCLLAIDEDNTAKLIKLSLFDKVRLRNSRLGITRILFSYNGFEEILIDEGVKHSPFKRMSGGCGTSFTVCDLLNKEEVTLLALKYPGRFRVLKANEDYYRAYDDKALWNRLQRDYDEYGLGEDDTDYLD
jgi:hypothetical protein